LSCTRKFRKGSLTGLLEVTRITGDCHAGLA
jgi:hypothetical protein